MKRRDVLKGLAATAVAALAGGMAEAEAQSVLDGYVTRLKVWKSGDDVVYNSNGTSYLPGYWVDVPLNEYDAKVLGCGPVAYWPLGDLREVGGEER